MGASPFFNAATEVKLIDQADQPECADILKTLKKGDRVRVKCTKLRVTRTASTYGQKMSSVDGELVVDNIDAASVLNQHGLRAIALRNPAISEDEHINAWYITTDGCVRESEHYGIMHMITDVEVIE